MNERTKTGLEIIKVAVVIGILGDVLLRVTPWGVNVLLFNAAFATALILLIRRHSPQYLTRHTIALSGALVFFAAMFAWRDSIELRIADTLAIVAVISVLFLHRMNVMPRIAGVFHYAVGFVWAGSNAVLAPFLLICNDVQWATIPREGWRKHAISAARGMAIAFPLVLLFGGLFVAADAAYEGLVQRVFNIRPEIAFSHFLLFGIFSWMTAGYLRGVLTNIDESTGTVDTPENARADSGESMFDRVRAESGEYPVTLSGGRPLVDHLNISDSADSMNPIKEPDNGSAKDDKPKSWQWAKFDNGMLPTVFALGPIEIGVILGLINLLFLSFVVVQVPYLFGGIELVQNTPDFKLAEYARRGFGELVTVSALVLPILLLSHWLIRKDSLVTHKLFRILAGVQIILLFVIMASATQRLVLLTGDLGYGLTTIRLYPMIFMIWLAIVFIWFGVTVLRGARQHFAWGALWSAFLILGATHALNPDEFIVKTNLALMQHGREFDVTYNSDLSDDAMPTLLTSFDLLNDFDQQVVIGRIARRYCEKLTESDSLSWNFSRWQAAYMISSNERLVLEIGDCNDGRFADRRDEGF